MHTTSSPNTLVLNSWKEIAQHVGRGVRTVQRWERDLGMPVRRPRAKSRSAVIAMAEEIDAWLRSAPTAELLPHREMPRSEAIATIHHAIQEHLVLQDRCNQLREANQRALEILMKRLTDMRQSVLDTRKSRETVTEETKREELNFCASFSARRV